jgi:hypothetical protein
MIAIAILIIFFIGFILITRPNSNTASSPTKKMNMADYAHKDSEVTYTLEGVINSEVNHRSIKISVNNHIVNITVFEGYQGNVLKSESYANNVDAYRSFLAGLQNSGFLKERKISNSVTMLGQCPTGLKYSFTTKGIDKAPSLLWTTSCGNSKGNFAGRLNTVTTLFNWQVPNYSQFVSGINLR